MSPLSDPQAGKRPGLAYVSMVLLAVLVLYPFAGAALTVLFSGRQMSGSGLMPFDPEAIAGVRVAQVVGQVLVLALPAFWLARSVSGSPTLFGRENLRWLGINVQGGAGPVFVAAAGMLLLQPLMYTIAEVQTYLLPLLGEQGQEFLRSQEQLEQLIRTLASSSSLPEFLAVAGMLVVTPAICEELFFRGYIQKSFSVSLPPMSAVILTGFVFALFHLEPMNILPLTLLGWFIGYIYQKTGRFAVPAVAHAMNNLTALTLLEFDRRFQGYSLSGGDPGILFRWQWWGFVLVCMVFFFLLMRRFQQMAASVKSEHNV
ncbi:MAG: CPBP family intramembrane metalloprotease [Chlorobiaceae bacterium]|nr:CPBP family intramembrane metalloprotease [Chlorobiaceae bacterium]NTW75051.1 CPBP family intramembrane metalloprotease [Chlorobiaceae bacterium]